MDDEELRGVRARATSRSDQTIAALTSGGGIDVTLRLAEALTDFVNVMRDAGFSGQEITGAAASATAATVYHLLRQA